MRDTMVPFKDLTRLRLLRSMVKRRLSCGDEALTSLLLSFPWMMSVTLDSILAMLAFLWMFFQPQNHSKSLLTECFLTGTTRSALPFLMNSA